MGPLVNSPSAIVAGDFDKNDTQGCRVGFELTSSSPNILSNNGNGDSNLDLVVVGTDPITGDWSYSVLLGKTDGSLKPPVRYPQSATATVIAVVVADFNNDGKPDIAITAGNRTAAVLLGNGNGIFAPPT